MPSFVVIERIGILKLNLNSFLLQLIRLFSSEDVLQCDNKSRLFSKRLVAVAISNLLYLRNIFPEDAFILIDFKHMKLRLFQTETFTNECATKAINNLFVFFDAFERNYSDEFMLEIVWQDMHENNINEVYHFKLCRHGENFTLIMCT